MSTVNDAAPKSKRVLAWVWHSEVGGVAGRCHDAVPTVAAEADDRLLAPESVAVDGIHDVK